MDEDEMRCGLTAADAYAMAGDVKDGSATVTLGVMDRTDGISETIGRPLPASR